MGGKVYYSPDGDSIEPIELDFEIDGNSLLGELAHTISGLHNEDETMFAGKYYYKEKRIKSDIDDTIGTKLDILACALSLELTSDEVSETLFTVVPYNTGINKPTDLKLSLTTLNNLTSQYLILYHCDESEKWQEETNDEWYNIEKRVPQMDYFSEYYHNRR
ncbi:MAG: hypothetical protein ACE5PV_12500 [Candidatus Poribacteria bacterium]